MSDDTVDVGICVSSEDRCRCRCALVIWHLSLPAGGLLESDRDSGIVCDTLTGQTRIEAGTSIVIIAVCLFMPLYRWDTGVFGQLMRGQRKRRWLVQHWLGAVCMMLACRSQHSFVERE